MKFIKNTLDKMRPNFEEGGKFYAFHSLFDAMDTFFLTPEATTTSGCHIRDAVDNKRTMFTVVIALIPALLFGMYNIGYQHYLSEGVIAAGDYCANFWGNFGYGLLKLLPMILVSYIVGLGIECIFAQVRKHEVSEGYFVTGMLIPLICPPDVPLWQLALAVAFAVIIGKEVFGGTGYNFLNPALVARAFLFFSYPIQMSGDTVWIAAQGDAISGARPGARREVVEAYINRLNKLEEMAMSYNGVVKTYAIQAGRELRVIVSAEKVSDQEANQISMDLSKRIQSEMVFPGMIKVTVIRETRSVNYAK